MNSVVFNSNLNDFCRKYLVVNPGSSMPSEGIVKYDEKYTSSLLFEQLLLFDSVSFKVYGENIPLAILIHHFGLNGFESLLEQSAIQFVLWNQVVSFIVKDMPGLDPLQFGTFTSKAHSDPEESIKLGFDSMIDSPTQAKRKALTKKLLNIYSLPEKDISGKAVTLVKSAFNSGKLIPYGLNPKESEYGYLKHDGRQLLCACADELLQYCHLLNDNISSYDNMKFYQMFAETNRKLIDGLHVRGQFSELSELEHIPDLKSLYHEIERPFDKLLSVRSKSVSIKFRTWLRECSESSDSPGITTEYVNSIANAKGFFDTKIGKFSKSVAMSAVGTGIGALLGGLGGALGGAGIGKALEPAAVLRVS